MWLEPFLDSPATQRLWTICGGTLRVIGRARLRITDPDATQKILDHIKAQPPRRISVINHLFQRRVRCAKC
jgi:hypothetical protein